MPMNLQEIADQLNTYESNAGATFTAFMSEQGDTLEVVCSTNPDASMFVVVSDQQILAVTPLFTVNDIEESMRSKLNATLLKLSPLIPLSSIGLQEDNYILFGSMSTNTVFENIAHEIEVQAENLDEVLDAMEPYFVKIELTAEV